jgi:hypothetical protein
MSAPRKYPSSIWKNRNFVSFFSGRLVTNAGDSLYSVAILWLVLQLSGSNFLTGVASALLLLPFLLQIIAGPIVDRFPLKRVLVWVQLVQGVITLVVPAAAYTGNLSVELVLVIIPALAVVNLMISPAQAALVPRIVADDQLSRSNSALATVTLGLDMIFEAVGGILIAVFGVMTLFLLDSVTFVVAGLLFVGMTIPAADGGNEKSEKIGVSEYVDDLRTGINILRGTVFVEMMFTTAVANFAVGVTLAILPGFGDLLGGPIIFGLMLGVLGTGRLLGSASASYLNDVAYGWLTVVGYLLSALLWLGSVYSPSLVLTVGLFGLAWIPAGINGVMVTTLNQKVFPDHLLGRVSSIKGTAVGATLPLGSLVGGLIAEQVGVITTMGLAAFGFGFVGLYFALRPPLRELPSMNDITPDEFNVDVESSKAAKNSD